MKINKYNFFLEIQVNIIILYVCTHMMSCLMDFLFELSAIITFCFMYVATNAKTLLSKQVFEKKKN